MWIIFFHYIVLAKAQTDADVAAAAATSWSSAALYWSNLFCHNVIFSFNKLFFTLKKGQILDRFVIPFFYFYRKVIC